MGRLSPFRPAVTPHELLVRHILCEQFGDVDLLLSLECASATGTPARGQVHEQREVGHAPGHRKERALWHAMRGGEEYVGLLKSEARTKEVSVLDHCPRIAEQLLPSLRRGGRNQQSGSRQRVDMTPDHNSVADASEVSDSPLSHVPASVGNRGLVPQHGGAHSVSRRCARTQPCREHGAEGRAVGRPVDEPVADERADVLPVGVISLLTS